ncbi:hypothetical protein C6501_11835 [Candidatus Poribacteria bacterium]|nr:MAG: hypothetical protein C6501_11835 [Candidatus Poribacteria bacterium]
MKILIFNSYTTGQKHKLDNPLSAEDCSSTDRLKSRIKELCGFNEEGWYDKSRDYRLPAAEMFTGPLYVQLREGLKQIREHEQYGKTTIDLYFPWYHCRVDGKMSPVGEKDTIVPFDTAPLHELAVLEFSENGVPEKTVDLLEGYDLVFSLLRQDDIKSLQRVFEVERATTLIFLLPKSQRKAVNEDLPNVHVVETGSALQKSLCTTNWALKGVVMRRLCEAACDQGFHVFEDVKQDPQRLIEIIQNQ